MGVRVQAPPKPDLLIAVELVNKTGWPIVAGGLMDQPHIWLLQFQMVNGIIELMDTLKAIEAAHKGSNG